jgi:hypothetical protein
MAGSCERGLHCEFTADGKQNFAKIFKIFPKYWCKFLWTSEAAFIKAAVRLFSCVFFDSTKDISFIDTTSLSVYFETLYKNCAV